eukprot:1642214-Amphidinium_carterae.1
MGVGLDANLRQLRRWHDIGLVVVVDAINALVECSKGNIVANISGNKRRHVVPMVSLTMVSSHCSSARRVAKQCPGVLQSERKGFPQGQSRPF